MVESHAPALEMLWEAHDPDEALDGRFGFSDGESATRWVAAMLNEHWGVRIQSCDRIVMSDHNALGSYAVRAHAREVVGRASPFPAAVGNGAAHALAG